MDPLTNSVIEVNKFGINAQTEKYKKVEINIEKKQIIDHNNAEDISDCLWMQVRDPQAYIISEGDVIRLGKQKLIAKSIRLFGSTNKNKPDTPRIKNSVESINMVSSRLTKECIVENQDPIDNGAVCRVCLEPNQDNDPFLNICLCSKHMPIHLSCIRRWLQKKAQTERFKNIIYCNLQELKCEVCQEEYPPSVFFKGNEYSLIDLKVEQNVPHIVFDICCRNTGVKKGFVVIYFESKKNEYWIGRADTNSINFNDSSVSRVHAILSMTDAGVSIRDCQSKYGTLVKVNAYNYRSMREQFFIQIDKFLFEIHPFVGSNCGCKLEKNCLVHKDPFHSMPELERNIIQDVSDPYGQTTLFTKTQTANSLTNLPTFESQNQLLSQVLENQVGEIKEGSFYVRKHQSQPQLIDVRSNQETPVKFVHNNDKMKEITKRTIPESNIFVSQLVVTNKPRVEVLKLTLNNRNMTHEMHIPKMVTSHSDFFYGNPVRNDLLLDNPARNSIKTDRSIHQEITPFSKKHNRETLLIETAFFNDVNNPTNPNGFQRAFEGGDSLRKVQSSTLASFSARTMEVKTPPIKASANLSFSMKEIPNRLPFDPENLNERSLFNDSLFGQNNLSISHHFN